MTETTLIIPTRDRPNYLFMLLKTVFQQTLPFETVIVSDNSSTIEFKEQNKVKLAPFLEVYGDKLFLIPTPQDFLSDVHTKYIQDNYLGKSKFSVLFHDDDEMLPHYHETSINALNSRGGIVAVGCNATKLKDMRAICGTVMRQNSGNTIIETSRELQKHYMRISSTAPPPLCGYLFKTSVLKSISFDSGIGGKYSDVVALSEAATFGDLIWLYEPLIRCRSHSGQDSQTVSTLGFRSLLNYMINKGEFSKTSLYVESYRFKHMRLKLKYCFILKKWRSARIVSQFLIRFLLKNLIWRKQLYCYLWTLISCK